MKFYVTFMSFIQSISIYQGLSPKSYYRNLILSENDTLMFQRRFEITYVYDSHDPK